MQSLYAANSRTSVDKSLVAAEAVNCFGLGGEHCGLRRINVVIFDVAHARKSKTDAKSPVFMMRLCFRWLKIFADSHLSMSTSSLSS
jgi:hypothetical protein